MITQLGLAHLAKIIDLRCVGIAFITKVFKLNVNLEIWGQNFTLVFSNIFRRKLHLARFDVVAVLNESCIEHNSEKNLVAEALVNKNDFGVAAHGEKFFLLISKCENDLFIFLSILSGGGERKYFCYFHTLTVVNNEAGSTGCTRNLWHFIKLDSGQPLHCG